MLTMVNPLMIEGHIVYQDDGNEVDALLSNAGRPAIAPQVRRFYALPEKPIISKDENGKPIFSLIVYRHDEQRLDPAAVPTRGRRRRHPHFHRRATVSRTSSSGASRRGCARWSSARDADDPSQDVDVTYVPFLEGKVSVAVAGETGTDTGEEREFVKNAVGTGKVGGIGQNRKAVMVKLTQAGASLMSQISR